MSKHSRMVKELRHEPVSGHSTFHNPHIRSSLKREASSPGATQSSQSSMSARKRRAVRPVPATLLDQCSICLEEQLFSQGFSILSSGLNAGLDTNAPACIPPPQHLALASTLVVHPSMTTKTDDQDRQAAANHALSYLREVVGVVGVQSAGVREAMQFGAPLAVRNNRLERVKTRRSGQEHSSDAEDDPGRLHSKYVEEQSLAENAQDFWAVVGWAFNCSIRHKARWTRWSVWLDLMLDVIQEDLEGYSTSGQDGPALADTLIARYMSIVGAGRNNKRRVMRAVLADGTAKSMAEFGEIWKNETKSPKKEKAAHGAKRQKLDLDNDDYGDYLDNESDEDTAENRPRRSRSATAFRSRRSRTPANPRTTMADDNDSSFGDVSDGDDIAEFGGMDAIRLRQRFLTLFTNFSLVAPNLFVDTEELFAIYTEFIRPLPLSVFQQFASPLRPYLSVDYQTSLNEMLFRPLLGTNATEGLIDQEEFERSFATSTATSVSATDNAKVSLLAESVLRALWTSGSLTQDLSRLKFLVEQGVRLRQDKVAGNGRRKAVKTADADDEAKMILEHSGQRMIVLLSMLAK